MIQMINVTQPISGMIIFQTNLSKSQIWLCFQLLVAILGLWSLLAVAGRDRRCRRLYALMGLFCYRTRASTRASLCSDPSKRAHAQHYYTAYICYSRCRAKYTLYMLDRRNLLYDPRELGHATIGTRHQLNLYY